MRVRSGKDRNVGNLAGQTSRRGIRDQGDVIRDRVECQALLVDDVLDLGRRRSTHAGEVGGVTARTMKSGGEARPG